MQFGASQKNGIIQLAVLLVLLCCFISVKNSVFSNEFNLKLNGEEQCWIDNQKAIAAWKTPQKKYTYYINNLDDHKGYMIGMSISEIDRYLNYKEKGKPIHTKEEFLRVTKMTIHRFDSIKHRLRFYKKQIKHKKSVPKVTSRYNLNEISSKELKSIGVPWSIANRIVNFRKYLGGYTNIEQLKKVYDITDLELKKIKSSVYLNK